MIAKGFDIIATRCKILPDKKQTEEVSITPARSEGPTWKTGRPFTTLVWTLYKGNKEEERSKYSEVSKSRPHSLRKVWRIALVALLVLRNQASPWGLDCVCVQASPWGLDRTVVSCWKHLKSKTQIQNIQLLTYTYAHRVLTYTYAHRLGLGWVGLRWVVLEPSVGARSGAKVLRVNGA